MKRLLLSLAVVMLFATGAGAQTAIDKIQFTKLAPSACTGTGCTTTGFSCNGTSISSITSCSATVPANVTAGVFVVAKESTTLPTITETALGCSVNVRKTIKSGVPALAEGVADCQTGAGGTITWNISTTATAITSIIPFYVAGATATPFDQSGAIINTTSSTTQTGAETGGFAVSSITGNGTTATATTANTNPFVNGSITIRGNSNANFNGTFTVTITSGTTFTFASATVATGTGGAASAGGVSGFLSNTTELVVEFFGVLAAETSMGAPNDPPWTMQGTQAATPGAASVSVVVGSTLTIALPGITPLTTASTGTSIIVTYVSSVQPIIAPHGTPTTTSLGSGTGGTVNLPSGMSSSPPDCIVVTCSCVGLFSSPTLSGGGNTYSPILTKTNGGAAALVMSYNSGLNSCATWFAPETAGATNPTIADGATCTGTVCVSEAYSGSSSCGTHGTPAAATGSSAVMQSPSDTSAVVNDMAIFPTCRAASAITDTGSFPIGVNGCATCGLAGTLNAVLDSWFQITATNTLPAQSTNFTSAPWAAQEVLMSGDPTATPTATATATATSTATATATQTATATATNTATATATATSTPSGSSQTTNFPSRQPFAWQHSAGGSFP